LYPGRRAIFPSQYRAFCAAEPVVQQIRGLRKEFQRTALDPSQRFALSADALLGTRQIIGTFAKLRGDQPCDLFSLALGASLWGGIMNLGLEAKLDASWDENQQNLGQVLDKLRSTMLNQDLSVNSKAVLSEMPRFKTQRQ
jgi:hypothetical protein